jgi:hypothetical protein
LFGMESVSEVPDPAVKYPWQQDVLDAFLELRPELLCSKINAAERAISARLCDPDPPDLDERIALHDALRSLRVLLDEDSGRRKQSGDKKEIA